MSTRITTCCRDCIFLARDHIDCNYCILDDATELNLPVFAAPPPNGHLPDKCPLKAGPITVELQK